MGDFTELKDLKISYDSGKDDILWDFYIPVLSAASRYDRIAGFFNSSSLAISARGMSGFIENGGKMRLVTCPQLSAADLNEIENEGTGIDDVLTKNFIQNYSEIEDQFQRDHVRALGWMLANNLLQIQIAVVKKNGRVLTADEIENSGIMHQKVGVLYDSAGHILTFSGSNNESYSGWIGNIEEFKVFKSWDSGPAYYQSDVDRFEEFWNKKRKDVELMPVPEAVRRHLIQEGKEYDPSRLDIRRYYQGHGNSKKKEELKLFPFQKDAYQTWEEQNRNLIFEMATGCGKTRTSIYCINKAMSDTDRLVVVIATPQVPLTDQWADDMEKLNILPYKAVKANGHVRDWDLKLEKEIANVSIGQTKRLVVFTTHATCSSDKFVTIIEQAGHRVTFFLVADEVHGLGSAQRQKALIQRYRYRLGLSATPERWFDESGTKAIEEYFGNGFYIYKISDALCHINPFTNQTFLAQYAYYPEFVSLTEDELADYEEKTKRAMYNASKKNRTEDDEKIYERILEERADIVKDAQNKYSALEKILDRIGPDIRDTIIFVLPPQIDNVMQMLSRRGIMAKRFTQEQGTAPLKKYGGKSERQHIIEQFKSGDVKVLVAIKCLDEGIDIPSASTGILMASSTNPREYIQRIGRIIRQYRTKKQANLYDIIVAPDLSNERDPTLLKIEKRIFQHETDRAYDLSLNAINNVDAANAIISITKTMGAII